MPTDIRALKKDGDQYYPETHAQAVVALNEGVQDIVNNEVFDSIRLASPDGTVFILSIDNNGKLSAVEEEPEE